MLIVEWDLMRPVNPVSLALAAVNPTNTLSAEAAVAMPAVKRKTKSCRMRAVYRKRAK